MIKIVKVVLAAIVLISLIFYITLPKINHQPPTTIRIMPIGDSITQGGNIKQEYTYRYFLYKLLKEKGYKVNFVGSRKSGLKNNFVWPNNFDSDHEGYYGQKTAYVANSVVKNLRSLEPVDWAVIYLGTNDREIVESLITDPLKNIIHRLREKNPNINILLVQIPGWRNIKIHFLIWKLSLELNSINSNVITLPLYIKWDKDKYTFDGAHPNPAGQSVLAKSIASKIGIPDN